MTAMRVDTVSFWQYDGYCLFVSSLLISSSAVQAAKEDNAGAFVGLGLLYKYGQGVTKSEAKAFEMFTKVGATNLNS